MHLDIYNLCNYLLNHKQYSNPSLWKKQKNNLIVFNFINKHKLLKPEKDMLRIKLIDPIHH